MKMRRYSAWGSKGIMFEFTASHSGCCGFYTKQTILYTQPSTCRCPPLEPVLLGKHSALQEETTVVLPCYRKVALRYMRFHLKLTQSTCRNCHDVRLDRSEHGHNCRPARLDRSEPVITTIVKSVRSPRGPEFTTRENLRELMRLVKVGS